jgi:hypothetical protein
MAMGGVDGKPLGPGLGPYLFPPTEAHPARRRPTREGGALHPLRWLIKRTTLESWHLRRAASPGDLGWPPWDHRH